MKKILWKISAAIAAAKIAFRQPDLMAEAHFRVMAGLYENVLKVMSESRPVMFQVCLIVPDDESRIVATVWMGAGINSSPTERIRELYEENQELKRRLSGLICEQAKLATP